MKPRHIWESFNCAIEGIMYVIKTQRNMRIHLLAAAIILILSLFLHLDKVEVIILAFTICLVLVTEMVNTALELIVNLITDTYHPLARMAKDIAAGAVFFSSATAIVVGYLVLFKKYLSPDMTPVLGRIKASPEYITFICIVVIFIFVVIMKAYSGGGTPMRGGWPSGHSALGFSVFTAAAFISQNVLLSILVFILAFMLAQSRVLSRIHTWWEILAGALLGMLGTTFIFQLFG